MLDIKTVGERKVAYTQGLNGLRTHRAVLDEQLEEVQQQIAAVDTRIAATGGAIEACDFFLTQLRQEKPADQPAEAPAE